MMAQASTWRTLSPTTRSWLLLGLPILYFLAIMASPLGSLARMAFSEPQAGRVAAEGFTLGNFAEIFTNPLYLDTFITTFRIGLFSAVVALLLGLPLAIYIWKARPAVRSFLIFVTITPILISIVVRAYGWIVLLSKKGLVNSALLYFGVIDEPLRLIFNEVGVVIATAHVLMPFMVLTILGSLQTINPYWEEAAASLGATPWRRACDVVIPLALPGIAAGSVLVFVLAAGSFVMPVLLGGQLVLTVPVLALQQFNLTFNWALGSAIVAVLLVALLLVTVLFERALQRRIARLTMR